MNDRGRVLLAVGLGLVVLGSLVAAGTGAGASAAALEPDSDGNVSEEAYVEPAPEWGDPYFEAKARDGSWVSYVNPRDEYRDPSLGDGSGKICVTLVNENGDPVVGESVPNTSVTIPTNDVTSWHSHADPMTVRFPMTDHYERPLDADQFGTSPDVAQGDGYMDSHCIEMHGHPENATIGYGEATVDGEHAERIDVVGYIQQAHMAGWDGDIDPVAAAEPYEEAGGGWTYRTDHSHGQAVVVLQLNASTAADADDPAAVADESTDSENGSDPSAVADGSTDPANGSTGSETDEPVPESEAAASGDEIPGFGVATAVVALSIAVLARHRR
jgi:PGF-CTERM protein